MQRKDSWRGRTQSLWSRRRFSFRVKQSTPTILWGKICCC